MDHDKLKAMLIKHEGLRLHVYNDSLGIPTIGVGHNLVASPISYDYSKGITDFQAMTILEGDIDKTLAFLFAHCLWYGTLDPVRQRAIVDMTFNLMGRLLGFKKMIAAIEAKDWKEASAQLLDSTFAKQTGQRAKDLAFMLLTGRDV